MKVILAEDLLRQNSCTASDNRSLLERFGVRAVNLISSPGAGKTSLLEKTILSLKSNIRIGVVEGDITTSRDAERIAGTGVPVVQVNTGGMCHLNAAMTGSAMQKLPLEKLDLVFIENVGNLVCPAAFELGEHIKAVLLSVTEGDDKPAKYPGTFLASGVALITKTDLIPHTDFDLEQCTSEIRELNSSINIFTTSVRTGEGIPRWCRWLESFATGDEKER